MAVREPINVTLLDPTEEIKTFGWIPTTSHQIYEASTTTFHPDGLFSEVIYGQVGSSQRMEHESYLNLNTTVFQPKIYRSLLALKGFYSEILAGNAYAKFDYHVKDFVLCDESDPEAGTGFAFFIRHYPDIEFKKNNSHGRANKIDQIEKYRNIAIIDKYLVEPAGLRDVKTKPNGQQSSEEINKLYLGLLSLTQGMPAGMGEEPIFDALRYNIQLKIMQIYAYLEDVVDGKHGFMLGKFAARTVALANRNVITAPPLSAVSSPKDPKYLRTDEVLTPLFQAAKGLVPHIVYSLKTIFMDSIFTMETNTTPLINRDSLELVYTEINDKEKALFTTDEGIEKLINLYRNNFIRHRPVTVQDLNGDTFFLYLVYDKGDQIYMFTNTTDFKNSLEGTHLWNTDRVLNLNLLERYGISKADCIVYGSAAMIAHGYPGSNQDLDLIVSEQCLTRLIEHHGFTEIQSPKGVVYVDPTKTIEVARHSVTLDMDFAQAVPHADIIDGYMFDSLKTCQRAYTQLPRPKDRYKREWLAEHIFDPKHIRPITYTELLYIATYYAVALGPVPIHATITRYPILNMYGTIPVRVNVQTTEPNRKVTLKHPNNPDLSMVLPRYPLAGAIFQDSMSVHPGALGGFNGDHDGDVLSFRSALSIQANREIMDFHNRMVSMINTRGGLISGLSQCKLGKYTLYAATRDPS